MRPAFCPAWSVALALVAAFLLASCGGGDAADGPDVERTPGEPVTVTVWHSMPSLAEGALERIVTEFNESQADYQVEMVFQGSYTESLNKLITSLGGGDIPSIIQLSDVSTQIMIDSQAVVPVQEFIDEEDYDLSDYEPKAIDYYTVDDTLYAMPFNLAGPVLYYDRAAFQDAGLDPDQPPRTLEEVREYSEALAQTAAPDGGQRAGIALEVSPWYFEQMLALSGALYVNNENGRAGRATEALFAGPEGVEIIEWWAGLAGDGLAYQANDTVDAMLNLASGDTAMAIASTAALRGAIAAISLAGRDIERYDVAPMPGPLSEDGGITVGGAAFWVLRDTPEEQQQGAWEFLKFASSPEQQAQWHADTGYFPSRISANELPPAVQTREELPQFQVALQQLRDAPDNPATRGALLGPFNAVRDLVSDAFEQALTGGADPAEALEAAQDAANQEIEDYNRTAP